MFARVCGATLVRIADWQKFTWYYFGCKIAKNAKKKSKLTQDGAASPSSVGEDSDDDQLDGIGKRNAHDKGIADRADRIALPLSMQNKIPPPAEMEAVRPSLLEYHMIALEFHENFQSGCTNCGLADLKSFMPQVLSFNYHQKLSARALVSKKKRRFVQQGFDLDLTYITPQLLAMGFPSEGTEAMFRNPMTEVQRFLNVRHPRAYRVYNLCSERSYAAEKFRGSVGCFPFDDHNPPPLQLLRACCEDILKWLGPINQAASTNTDDMIVSRENQHGKSIAHSSSQRVAAIHCKAGKGRTGTVIAAYLVFSGDYRTAQDALEYYGHARSKSAKGVTIPSQIRYVYYFVHWLRSPAYQFPLPRVTLALERVILHGGAPTYSAGGSDPYFKAKWGYNGVTEGDFNLKKISPIQSAHGPEAVVFECSGMTGLDALCGDVLFLFYHADKRNKAQQKATGGGDAKMFTCWFNTAFVDAPRLLLPKMHLDKATKDKKCKHFSRGFAVEFIFAPQAIIGAGDVSTGVQFQQNGYAKDLAFDHTSFRYSAFHTSLDPPALSKYGMAAIPSARGASSQAEPKAPTRVALAAREDAIEATLDIVTDWHSDLANSTEAQSPLGDEL
eukprot:SAG31_NODE_1389_length_8545_cov_3.081103_10_plen_614_part_00